MSAIAGDELFRAVFLDAVDAMLILDDERIVIEANPAACALFGGDQAVVANLSFDDLVTDGSDLAAVWPELLALGEVRREHRVRDAVVECVYRARVRPDRHLCIARDITSRRALEDRVAQSEKIESVGRLAGGIAHDFNNLLTAILGFTELLLDNRTIGGQSRADLEEIQRAGARAALLTQQLLAFSRRQVLRPRDVDLNETVVNLQTMIGRLVREDIVLHYELSPEPAVVRIDPAQIEQVLLNLVLNSRDALPSGGAIRIDVARVHHSEVELPPDSQVTTDDFVRLRVSDTGIGIAPEARAHLFEPFYTTKGIGKGTGLGLASAYGIVRQSNGFISVDSQPGAGTVVAIHVPATAPARVIESAPC